MSKSESKFDRLNKTQRQAYVREHFGRIETELARMSREREDARSAIADAYRYKDEVTLPDTEIPVKVFRCLKALKDAREKEQKAKAELVKAIDASFPQLPWRKHGWQAIYEVDRERLALDASLVAPDEFPAWIKKNLPDVEATAKSIFREATKK